MYGAPRRRHSIRDSLPASPMQNAIRRPCIELCPSRTTEYRDSTLFTSSASLASVTILAMSAPYLKQRARAICSTPSSGVPLKSWYERMSSVPFSRHRAWKSLLIWAGASISRSANLAPASTASLSLCSASLAEPQTSIRHVATSGMSLSEKSSFICASSSGHESSLISASSTSLPDRIPAMAS